jgi:hypothetical protein
MQRIDQITGALVDYRAYDYATHKHAPHKDRTRSHERQNTFQSLNVDAGAQRSQVVRINRVLGISNVSGLLVSFECVCCVE